MAILGVPMSFVSPFLLNGAVLLLVVVIVVVVLIALAIWAVRRRNADEVHSVEGYRHTIETLQGIRTTSSGVRVLGSPGEAGSESGPTDRLTPPVGPIGSSAIPPPARAYGSDGPLVFEDAGVGDRSISREGRGGQRTQMRAMSAMNHRPRRLGAPILVAVVVVVLAVILAIVGARSGHHKTPSASTTVPSTAAHSSTATSHQQGTAKKKTTGHAAAAVTTTTAPQSFKATTSTANTASYTTPTTTYDVTVTATTGDCWVQVHSVATGTTPLAMTLTPGQTQTVKLTGINTLLVGAPSVVQVTIDKEPVVLPTGYGVPFTMTFEPTTS